MSLFTTTAAAPCASSPVAAEAADEEDGPEEGWAQVGIRHVVRHHFHEGGADLVAGVARKGGPDLRLWAKNPASKWVGGVSGCGTRAPGMGWCGYGVRESRA